jgi:hypothetical protein
MEINGDTRTNTIINGGTTWRSTDEYTMRKAHALRKVHSFRKV